MCYGVLDVEKMVNDYQAGEKIKNKQERTKHQELKYIYLNEIGPKTE